MQIRNLVEDDIPNVVQIYNHYVQNDTVTFEEQLVSNEEMLTRAEAVRSVGLPWLVSIDGDQLMGYAYATPWKARSAYRFSVEISIYLAQQHQQAGIGTKLYTALFDLLKKEQVNAVMGGITLPNPASVALHEKFDMRQVAQFEQVGYKFGRWLDVGYWQVQLRAANAD